MIEGSNLATRSAGWRMADISLCKVSFSFGRSQPVQ
jgi:hypothetical protein